VFVVVNPDQDPIWVDPVLSRLDQRLPRPIRIEDIRVETCRRMSGIGFVPGGQLNVYAKPCTPCAKGKSSMGKARVGISDTEQNLLDSVKEYSDGVADAITQAQANNTLNTICTIVLATASIAFPIIVAALAAIKAADVIVTDEFGAGSLAARLLSDISNNPLTAPYTIIESIFSGRTYESDQYRAAQYYEFYVLGNASANALNKIPDSAVVPALKWFVDRLGVFISGAQHIDGLVTSPAQYMSYYGVNNYTTMDTNRVNAASNVAQMYFVKNNVAGSWANTLGVYDQWIATLATENNETVEQAAASVNYTDVYSTAATSGSNPVTETPASPVSSFPVVPVALALAAAVILIPSTPKNKKNG
jgi:hypothetical protein